VAKTESKPRWSTERRLEFIEFRLFWEGRINRSDLVEFFSISVPQASADLNHYQTVAEGNIEYDKTAKAYVVAARFKPIFFTPSADRFLAELRLLDANLLPEDETWILKIPSHSIVPTPRRKLDPKVLRHILDAIRTRSSLEVNYQSFTRPEPTWRRLAPHAIAFDGLRWHVRAWCHTRGLFLDFVIGRMFATRSPLPAETDPKDDAGWNTEVIVKIGPHPQLTDGTRRVTEIDYGMENGSVALRTRACMVPSLEDRLGLVRKQDARTPNEQQIVYLNRDEVEPVLVATGVRQASSPNKKS
jgi:hypothetical protein